MPFPNERGAVAGFPEQRWQRRLRRRQTGNAGGSERFLETDGKPILIATGDERDTRRRADGGICVGLKKPHAVGGETIDVRRVEVRPAITCNVGVTEIVGEDENDVRGTRCWLPERLADAGRDRERAGCRLP